jgi:hypothetical protein
VKQVKKSGISHLGHGTKCFGKLYQKSGQTLLKFNNEPLIQQLQGRSVPLISAREELGGEICPSDLSQGRTQPGKNSDGRWLNVPHKERGENTIIWFTQQFFIQATVPEHNGLVLGCRHTLSGVYEMHSITVQHRTEHKQQLTPTNGVL